MSKFMYITVGTSLFHSATWMPDAMKEDLPQYVGWATDLLDSPEQRLRDVHSDRVRHGLENLLDTENGAHWAARLPEDLRQGALEIAHFRRYSAELSTIVKLAEVDGQGLSLRDFLRSYESIYLVCDPDSYSRGPKNLPLVAAAHLISYLNLAAGATGLPLASLRRIRGLSSTDPATFLGSGSQKGALERLADEIGETLKAQPESLDLVISGGFKFYGVVLSPLVTKNSPARLIYIHETGNDLMIYSKDHLSLEKVERQSPILRIRRNYLS